MGCEEAAEVCFLNCYLGKWPFAGLSSSTHFGPIYWALMSTSCSGALHARLGRLPSLSVMVSRPPAAPTSHQTCVLLFSSAGLLLHRFDAGQHCWIPCSSIANARSKGVMHGFNFGPRPVHSPASPSDCTPPAQNGMPSTTSRRCSAGNGDRRAGLDGVSKVCTRLLQRIAVASSFLRALIHHHAHSSCSASSPLPCISGHLWGSNADVLTLPGQMAAQVDGEGRH